MPNPFQPRLSVRFALLSIGDNFTIKPNESEQFTKIEEAVYDERPTVCNGRSLTDGKLWKFANDVRVYPITPLVEVKEVE